LVPSIEEGASFQEAPQEVRESTIFTTHTPMPAGTDVFPFRLIEEYLGNYVSDLSTDRDTLLELGTNPEEPGAGFNTTVFALRVAAFRKGISQRHREVACKMWGHLWPDEEKEQVAIEAITNGVNLPSWIDAIWLQPVLADYLDSH
jgi:starch phosphorylase